MKRPVILCVDDERIILSSLKAQLHNNLSSDYEIEVAESAAEALEIIHELIKNDTEIPVAIVDQIMPGMKGDELLSIIKELIPQTKTIMLTGQASAEAVGEAVNKAGLFRYLSKPWDEDDLILTIQSAIDSFVYQKSLLIQSHYQAVINQTLTLALSTLSFEKQAAIALNYLLQTPCLSPPTKGALYFYNQSHLFSQDRCLLTREQNIEPAPPDHFSFKSSCHSASQPLDNSDESKEIITFQRVCELPINQLDDVIHIQKRNIDQYSHANFFPETRNFLAHYIYPITLEDSLKGLLFIFVQRSFHDTPEIRSFLSTFSQTLAGMYRLSASTHALRITNHQLEQHKFELETLVKDRTKELNKALSLQEENNQKLMLANKELAFFATTDSLTGLLNRRHFFSLAEELAFAINKQKRPCVVAMIDIDHFKPINDNFGHETGDEALRLVAQIIKNSFDDQALIGRYGGEEFSILLPDIDIGTALHIFKQLSLNIQEAKLHALSEVISLTVSIGISNVESTDVNIEKALFRADEALYFAKDNGRNTISIYNGNIE